MSHRVFIVVGLALLAVFTLGFLFGQTGSLDAPADLRPSEIPGPSQPAVDGELAFRVLAWRCGLLAVAGDHADWLPDGEYCRIRIRLENLGRAPTTFEAANQEVQAADGRRFRADLNSTQIADQPTTLEVKGRAAYEFDLWFDVPENSDIVSATLRHGSSGPGATVTLVP